MTNLPVSLWEANLRQRLQGNDRAAFESVTRSHYARVYWQLWCLSGGDETLCADLTQETFVTAWQSLETFEAAIATLPPAHRRVVRLFYHGEMRYREVALAENIAEGTAKSREGFAVYLPVARGRPIVWKSMPGLTSAPFILTLDISKTTYHLKVDKGGTKPVLCSHCLL